MRCPHHFDQRFARPGASRLKDILTKIPPWPNSRLAELLRLGRAWRRLRKIWGAGQDGLAGRLPPKAITSPKTWDAPLRIHLHPVSEPALHVLKSIAGDALEMM